MSRKKKRRTLTLNEARQLGQRFGLPSLWQNPNPEAKFVYSKDGKNKGVLTGGERACRLEGCLGVRLGTKWPDGKITWPCTDGMEIRPRDKQWIIES